MNADEKLCPFCAETIKSAAVRCRFCRSDLPPDDEQPLVEPQAESTPEPEPADDDAEPATAQLAPPADHRPAAERSPLVIRAVLLVAAVALAAGSSWFFMHDRGSERADGLTLGGDQQVVTESFRDEAKQEAGDKAAAILSYSYKTLADDEAKAKALMAPDFAAEYASAMADNKQATIDSKITQKATVAAASLVSLEPRSAKVLVFVDLSTTVGDSPTPRSSKERALVSMTRKDGDWIVTDVDAF